MTMTKTFVYSANHLKPQKKPAEPNVLNCKEDWSAPALQEQSTVIMAIVVLLELEPANIIPADSVMNARLYVTQGRSDSNSGLCEKIFSKPSIAFFS